MQALVSVGFTSSIYTTVRFFFKQIHNSGIEFWTKS